MSAIHKNLSKTGLRWLFPGALHSNGCKHTAFSKCEFITKPLTVVAVCAAVALLLSADSSQSMAQQSTVTNKALSCFAPADSADSGGTARNYLLSPGDQLQILVYQREDLSRTHTISEDGMVSLPLLGRLAAAGKTMLELEKLVAQTIEKITGRTEHVSIELPTRRPVYVVGLVNTPGAYAYTTDMTVLHALALSGGLFRPDERNGGLAGISRENARLGQSRLQLKQALALEARLKAELSTKKTLEAPARLVKIEGKTGAESSIARQAQIMDKRAEAHEKQIVTLQKTAELTKVEIKTLRQREKLIADQINLANEELGAVNILKQKGLLRRSDLFTMQRVIASLEADLRATQARVIGAQRRLLEGQERLQLLNINKNLNLEQELNRAENTITSTETAIRSSQWIVGEMTNLAQQEEKDNKVATVQYQIVRTAMQRQHLLLASELTPLCPGDIVQVQPAAL